MAQLVRWAMAAASLLGLAAVVYGARHASSTLRAPVLKSACHGIVYVCAGVTIAGELGATSLVAAIATTAYVAGLSELANAGRHRRLAAAGLVGAPLVIALTVAHRSLASATLAIALIGIARRALRLARGGDRERASVLLLAGMSLVDAALLGAADQPTLAIAAAAAPVATRAIRTARADVRSSVARS